LACPARGQTGQGNIGIHSCKDKRFLCTVCRKTFSATQGTAFSRLRTSAETVSLVVTLLAHGCPLQAIVVAFGSDERTVAGWVARAGNQGQAVQEPLVEPPRDLGQVHADEIRVQQQGGIVWMALAMMVKTRLWLGGAVSEQRDMPPQPGLGEHILVGAGQDALRQEETTATHAYPAKKDEAQHPHLRLARIGVVLCSKSGKKIHAGWKSSNDNEKDQGV
jgi:transposase-like protein